jgi:hypothetical protein
MTGLFADAAKFADSARGEKPRSAERIDDDEFNYDQQEN